MMRRVRFLHYLLLPLLLSGCFAFTVSDGRPGMYGDSYFLDSLVGKTSEIVLREFGIPDELLFDGQTRYMVYSTRGSGTSQGFITYIPLPVTPSHDDAIKHCLRFELDNDNLVKAYKIKSKSTSEKWIVFMPVGGGPVNCRDLFWNKKELTKLQMTTSFPSEWYEIVTQGNPDLQLALFKDLRRTKPEVALIWLCRSADSGNQEAIVILRNIYENGGYPWIRNGIVDADFRLAYVWFMQSGSDLPSQAYLASLTTEERLDAEKMLKEWQPGDCERELGLVGG